MTKHQPYTLDRVVRLVISTITIVGILYLVRYLSPVLVPFFVALFIVYLIDPLVRFFQHKLYLKKRIFAVIATFILLGGVISVISTWLIPLFINEMVRMAHLIKAYVQVAGYKNMLPGDLDLYLKEFIEQHQVQEYFNPKNISILIQKSMMHFRSFISGSMEVASAVGGVLIVVLYVIFLLFDFENIDAKWPQFVPDKYRKLTIGIIDDVKNGMNTYFRMQGLIAFIVGILMSIGFSIIGLPLAIFLGLFIGLLNLVPYLQLVGLIPALLLALLKALDSGNSFWHEAFLVLLVISIVQIIQDVILTPKIMGKAYGLNPAIILLSLSVWGSLLGFIGLLLALPLSTIIISYYKRFILFHEPFLIDEE
ncbi:MAG: AI-2E family transporter [Marinilabiliaceae bacterium]|nr:AI-2E family transporter [Marinilabiliaceae bacterium]